MPSNLVLAFAMMAFVSSITPGPNNLMLMASGINHGFRATVPHLLGVNIGFLILLLAVAFGLAELFRLVPGAHAALRWIGAAYLLYLSWRVASAPVADPSPSASDARQPSRGRPLGFLGAAAFQWVNPKAWVMAASAFTTFLPPQRTVLMTLAFAILFAAVNAPCITAWALFGTRLRTLLQHPARRRIVNRLMGLLLAASLWPLLR